MFLPRSFIRASSSFPSAQPEQQPPPAFRTHGERSSNASTTECSIKIVRLVHFSSALLKENFLHGTVSVPWSHCMILSSIAYTYSDFGMRCFSTIIINTTDSAMLTISAIGNAHQTFCTAPVRESRYAVGISTNSWRPTLVKRL